MSTALPSSATIAVIGAGTMGAGIAQVAAAAGHPVLLFDAMEGAAARGRDGVAKALQSRVDKGRMDQAEKDALVGRIRLAGSIGELAPAALVIEAIVENLEIKQKVFKEVEQVAGGEVILATNTSSLSITSIGAALSRPERLVGMHFFNPAPLLPLVEVISGAATAPEVAETVFATAATWGKSPVKARSTPGFIVNRIARPYYAEAMRVLQEGGGDPATLDAIMRESGGFRMGPFELMDLIGLDINYAVANSVFDAYYKDERFLPSLVQKDLVEAGWLGRKTGRGFFSYADGATPPSPATAAPGPKPAAIVVRGDLGPAEALVALAEGAGIKVTRQDGKGDIAVDAVILALTDGRSATERTAVDHPGARLVVFDLALDYTEAKRIGLAAADQAGAPALQTAAGFFQAIGKAVSVMDDVPGMIVARTVAMLANEASDAVLQGVASPRDVDVAMMKGVNYPKGPLAWADALGLARVNTILLNLLRSYGEDRYRASALLRRKMFGEGSYHG